MNKAAITYISITYLIFIFGPWPYPFVALDLLTLFVTLIFLTFLLNALLFKELKYELSKENFNDKYSEYIIFGGCICLLLGIIEYFRAYPEIVPLILEGDLGGAYLYLVTSEDPYLEVPLFMFASVLFSPFLYISLGMIFFYDYFSPKIQKLLILFGIVYILRFLLFGQLKGVVDVGGVFSLYLLRKGNFSLLRLIFRPQVIFLSSFFGLLAFTIHLSREYGLEYGTFGEPLFIQTERPYFQDDSILESFYVFFELVSRYFGHGYYALSQSFIIDFKPDIISSSLFVNDNFEDLYMDSNYSLIKILGDDFGWDYKKLWHTQFLWWISGFGFAGAILIIFFQQFFYLSLISRASSKNSNYFELGIIGILSINFIYMPLNNQIFYNFEGVFSLFILTVLAISKKLLKPKL